MDRTDQYREILKHVVNHYAEIGKDPPGVRTYACIDPIKDVYGVESTGWENNRRVYGRFIHLDLKDGKIWIQHDGTNRPVADELEAAGVPKEDIVLGFISPDRRQYTGYALG